MIIWGEVVVPSFFSWLLVDSLLFPSDLHLHKMNRIIAWVRLSTSGDLRGEEKLGGIDKYWLLLRLDRAETNLLTTFLQFIMMHLLSNLNIIISKNSLTPTDVSRLPCQVINVAMVSMFRRSDKCCMILIDWPIGWSWWPVHPSRHGELVQYCERGFLSFRVNHKLIQKKKRYEYQILLHHWQAVYWHLLDQD